jgi:hypothetical protein
MPGWITLDQAVVGSVRSPRIRTGWYCGGTTKDRFVGLDSPRYSRISRRPPDSHRASGGWDRGHADEGGRAALAGRLVAAVCLFDWDSLGARKSAPRRPGQAWMY